MSRTRLTNVACISLLAAMLSACGSSGGGTAGGGSLTPPNGGNPQEPTVEGIAMPSSVSVVTATNAS